MATPYGQLLLAVYELEGLLLVVEKHGDDTPAEVFDLIKQKAAYIAEASQNVPIPQQEAEEEMLEAALAADFESVDETPVEAVEEDEIEEDEVEVEHDDDDFEDCESYDEEEEASYLPPKQEKALRQAFSINDSIRFCRELFGNSKAEYNDALNMVQAMKSKEEVDEYFYDYLGWNRDNEVVAEFMSIIQRYFGR